MKYEPIDGEEAHRTDPQMFQIAAKAALTPGRFVKVSVRWDLPDGVRGPNGERFWVRITSIENGRFRETVDNDLLFTEIHGLANGDDVVSKPCHVPDVLG